MTLLFLRAVSFCCLAGAGLWPAVSSADLAPGRGPRREEMRDAVAAHRAAQREQVRADEAAAGRRLTPAERAELREQLRSQWPARQEAMRTADSATAPHPAGPAPGGGWRALWPWGGPRP